MRSRPIPILAAVILAASALPAAAQVYDDVAYGHARYGYADEFVRGSYVGAPLTRVPSPSRLVPTPWSYGTYGIPTVSGLPPTPVGQPVVTVINGRDGGATSRGDGRAAARVIEVEVPRR